MNRRGAKRIHVTATQQRQAMAGQSNQVTAVLASY